MNGGGGGITGEALPSPLAPGAKLSGVAGGSSAVGEVDILCCFRKKRRKTKTYEPTAAWLDRTAFLVLSGVEALWRCSPPGATRSLAFRCSRQSTEQAERALATGITKTWFATLCGGQKLYLQQVIKFTFFFKKGFPPKLKRMLVPNTTL